MAARRVIETIEASFPLELYQGLAYSKSMTWTGGDHEPVNLTGMILSIKIKDVFPTQLNLFSNTGASPLGSTITITNAAQGEFRIKLTEDETATARLGTGGKYWIEWYSGDDQDVLWIDGVCVQEL